jgi:N utilization substance protein B
MHKRTQAREVALQLLFQHDLNPEASREDVHRFLREQIGEAELESFALSLYEGTLDKLADIDARLGHAAENWRLSRMAVIDRNILRLGTHELDRGETPASVVLNESIELARRFGSADSPAFVNGVLDRLYKQRTKEEGEPHGEPPSQPA